MKTTQELYTERLNRITKAVRMEKTDKVPVIPCGTAFCANHLGVKMSEFCLSTKLSNETIIKSFTSLGDIDGIQVQMWNTHTLSMLWFNKVKLPGYELPEGTLWQMNEGELMTIEDYDAIIDKGFNAWAQDYYLNRLDNLMDKLGEELAYAPKAMDKFVEAGIVSFSPFTTTTPYEMFCGGRTMVKFTKDLFKYADKVQAAMDVAMPDILANIKQFAAAPSVQKPIAAWVGGWRGASEFLSPKMWNRFIWPYYKKIVEEVVAAGIIPVLHLDSNWDRDIEYFRELPKGKCVFSPDGSTNIFKVKEVLGDHMCIMGDIPAALLTLGNPDEVYKYATKLINEIGPAGLIMASGCDIPANAKPENVAAMISSCAYR